MKCLPHIWSNARKHVVPLFLAWSLLCGQAIGGQTSSALRRATAAFYRGEFEQAARLTKELLAVNPKDAAAGVLLARAVLAQGQLTDAFEQLTKVLAIDPHNVDALYYLSIVARELSQHEYQKLLAAAPDSDRVHQLLAEAALAAENSTEAEAELKKALKANPRSIDAATELAELKRSQSKFDEAIDYYTRAAQIGPLNYDIAYGLGACYTYKQDYSQATDWLRRAVGLAPESAAGHFALGNSLFQSAQYEPAISELRLSLRIEPRLKQAYFLLGRAYSKLGRQDEAKAALQKLDELNRAEVPASDQQPSTSRPDP